MLYWFGQRSSRVKYQGRGADVSSVGTAGAVDPKALAPTILAPLSQLPVPPQQRERVARTVSDIVTKTLEVQVGKVKRELDERYIHIIDEQRRNEVILQRKYQETLQEKKQTTSVLESIAEGLVVINNKGEVVMMNPAAERLLAVKQEERIGKPLLDHIKDEQLISLVRGANEEQEIVLAAKQDSTKRVLRASNAVITDEDGKTSGGCVTRCTRPHGCNLERRCLRIMGQMLLRCLPVRREPSSKGWRVSNARTLCVM